VTGCFNCLKTVLKRSIVFFSTTGYVDPDSGLTRSSP